MMVLKVIFWSALIIVFYSYLGYGIFLWIYVQIADLLKKPDTVDHMDRTYEPDVTLVIATYNEETIIEEKINNCRELDYPGDKIQYVFVADGSNDNTVDILRSYKDVQIWYEPERKGKSAAINRVMPHIQSPITIFTDANTFLNKDCIKNIVRHYQDPKIGAVAGEKKIDTISSEGNTAGAGEGLYWKYESFLKQLDARFYSVVGAAGELFSIRTGLYEPVASNILLDDFMISMKICLRGYKVMYDPEAYATELPSSSLSEERKRKIRIAAGGFQSVLLLQPLLNIFKFGKLSFQYISHRVLRWVVCPLLLPIIWLINLFICLNDPAILYNILFISQCTFYLAALAGWLFTFKQRKVPLLYIAYYFTFMNIAMYLGFSRFIQNKQSVLWDKATRANAQPK